ncbi:MAG: BBP7 family outer membrane beta-barrel protein, partial [Planctomycetaceae bacterium]|nr:BBP7 family outer membrane beta-barrel protein [Planctomycetaceae bacterium]
VKFSNSLDITSLELMYTYRPYPLKWGSMNLYGGLRHFDVRDSFGFTGISYGNPTQIIVGGSTSTSSDDTSTSTDTTTDTTDDDDDEDTTLDIANLMTTIRARVKNQITGPQVAARIERRLGRWTCSAEGRLLAGFNKQTSTVSGKFASQFIDAGSVDLDGDGQVAPYKMIAFTNRPQAFYHRSSRDVFSPAFELKLNLRWQWTDYVGFNVGFNSTIIDNVGRGADVIDYRFNSDGSLFNIRKSDRTLTAYGLNFGISVRR